MEDRLVSLLLPQPVPSKLADKQNARPTALTLDAQTITERDTDPSLNRAMFPWSDQTLRKRLRKRRKLQQEEEILDSWSQDVCSGEELPEVEIISLLEEQIPKYKLRADTLTSFSGYENDDWYCPSLKPEDVSPLTPEQIRETLNYFCEYH
ncbi:unnamed protein product [Nezara viridula]|uniref:HAP1 N-terminal domain-containing protein n=1 Tax=Nezara viridula TaxID=85310 RepID=A0A9P0HN59_NEZVI|nr:unnamed protein product [Nezara viridula]